MEHDTLDFLTGFYRREALGPFLEDLICEAGTHKHSFSLSLVDLDRFKHFNDKFGHAFGDEILKYFASVLRFTFNQYRCRLFRHGGDEFIVVLMDKGAREMFQLLRQCNYNMARRPFLFENKFYKVKMSCGIAGFPDDARRVDDLIRKADEAMYFSKRHGRNRSTFAGRLHVLAARNIIIWLAMICLAIAVVAIGYNISYDKFIQPVMRKIKNAHLTTKPKDLDVVILKNGGVFEGRIIDDSQESVLLDPYLKRGAGMLRFKKTEIEKIKYGRQE